MFAVPIAVAAASSSGLSTSALIASGVSLLGGGVFLGQTFFKNKPEPFRDID